MVRIATNYGVARERPNHRRYSSHDGPIGSPTSLWMPYETSASPSNHIRRWSAHDHRDSNSRGNFEGTDYARHSITNRELTSEGHSPAMVVVSRNGKEGASESLYDSLMRQDRSGRSSSQRRSTGRSSSRRSSRSSCDGTMNESVVLPARSRSRSSRSSSSDGHRSSSRRRRQRSISHDLSDPLREGRRSTNLGRGTSPVPEPRAKSGVPKVHRIDTMMMTPEFNAPPNHSSARWNVNDPTELRREILKLQPIIEACRICPISHETLCQLGSCTITARHIEQLVRENAIRTASKGFRGGSLADDSLRLTLRRKQTHQLDVDLHCSGVVHQHLEMLKLGQIVIAVRYHARERNVEDRFILHRGQVVKILSNTQISLMEGKPIDHQFTAFLFCAAIQRNN